MRPTRNSRGLGFKGIQKTTLVDFPGEVACTLFLPGCNFRCPYCYNPDLVLDRETGVRLSEAEALEFLEARRPFLDGVCISGGEPLLHGPALAGFLRAAKALGYQVKLDTNGSHPSALRQLLDEHLVDYVAMDIKAPLEQYEQVARRPVARQAIQASAELIRGCGRDYEFRTTVFQALALDDFDRIGRWLSGSRRYCLQPVRTDMRLLDATFAARHQPPTPEDLQRIAQRLRPYVEQIIIRA
jgi:pyruvate formate lyase activating enzyme